MPYVFATGNHDSPDVVARLRETPNVVLVDEEVQDIMGLRLAGIGDPAAKRYSPEPAGLDELYSIAQAINEHWGRAEDRPDVFIVHNHRVAQQIHQGCLALCCAATVTAEITEREGTVYINAGTTGAGHPGFQSRNPPLQPCSPHYARL